MAKLGRKKTGGKYIKRRKKKKYERTGQKNVLKIGGEKRKVKRVLGAKKKNNFIKSEVC